MKKIQKKAFTMIELLVVITIIAIVSIFTYTPYIYYKNKALVNFSTKTLAQSIFTARSLAINGVSSGSGNLNKNMNIGLYLETGKNDLVFYGYTGSSISNGKEIKKIPFENGVWVSEINNGAYTGALIYFSAIKGIPKFYKKNTSGNFEEITGTGITIKIGYKGHKEGLLSKELKYYKNTFVIDYK